MGSYLATSAAAGGTRAPSTHAAGSSAATPASTARLRTPTPTQHHVRHACMWVSPEGAAFVPRGSGFFRSYGAAEEEGANRLSG